MSHRKVYYTLPEACTGCRLCEMACSLRQEESAVNPEVSRIRIRGFPDKGVFIPKVCRLCRKPACVAECPEQALTQNAETGVIVVDVEKCNGCGICVDACKFDSIHLHPVQNTPMVCDLCGGKPQCVRYCMNGTLVFVTPEEYREVKNRAGKKEGEPKWPTHTHSV